MSDRTPVRRPWHAHPALLPVATFLAALGIAYVVLELWAARLSVPLLYWGDALPTGAHFKTVIETGWYEFQPLLGAPAGQTYHDFPTADNLHFMVARVLGLFTQDWASAMNLYYILGFPLAALTAAWFLRRVGVSRAFSFVLALLFAFAPYHFLRSESHLWLSSYYVIPLALVLVIDVIRGQALWVRRQDGPRVLRFASPRTLQTIGILAITGTAQSYYAVFFLILLAFAGIVRLIRSGQWRRFWGAAAAGGVTVVVMLINMAPDILFLVENGANPAGFERGNTEAERLSLKLAQLLLPWPGHRIGALSEARALYEQHYPFGGESPALGIVGALGLVIGFLVVAYAAATWGSAKHSKLLGRDGTSAVAELSALTFVAFIFATFGGLSTIISFFTASIRGWNRMSIVMALLCLAVVGVVADALLRKVLASASARRRVVVTALAAGVVLTVGIYDQTPANLSSTYASTIAKFDDDRAWFESVERDLPAGSFVLQLPYQPFPETTSPNGLSSSEALIPYLHTEVIRWTAGGIKGRPTTDWTGVVGAAKPSAIATLAAASGAAAIQIDRAALTTTQADELENALDEAVPDGKRTSDDGRWVLYPLEQARDDLEAEFSEDELASFADHILDPVTLTLGPSFIVGITPEGRLEYSNALTGESTVLVTSGREQSVAAQFELRLDGPGTRVQIELPDGTTAGGTVVDGEVELDFDFSVPAGAHRIAIVVLDGGEPVSTSVTIVSATLTADALERLLSR